MASSSPRRHFLLREAGFNFEIKTREIDESFPGTMPAEEVAEFIALKKAEGMKDFLEEDAILLTADTTVVYNNMIYGKPEDKEDAYRIIREISGTTHEVITGVCLMSDEKTISFSVTTEVEIDPMSDEEIYFYINKYKPFDKAGAYGIQEWFGWNKVSAIKGSYTNVMGLPMSHVYQALKSF